MIRSVASSGHHKNSVVGFSSRLEERAEKRKEVIIQPSICLYLSFLFHITRISFVNHVYFAFSSSFQR